MTCKWNLFLVVLYILSFRALCGGVRFPFKLAVNEAKERTISLINHIFERFELRRQHQMQLFMTIMNMDQNSWQILKWKVLNSVMTSDSKFVVVFGGTSVTAGYDNYFNQTYPRILEQRLKPIFDALQVDLNVRNIAQNHIDCRLSNYCFDSVGVEAGVGGGESPAGQVDVIGWENSFDCGNAKDAHEFIARVAGWHGAALLFSTSGSFPLDGCPPTKDNQIPSVSEDWVPPRDARRVTPQRAEIEQFRQLHQRWFDRGNPALRFTEALGDAYKGVGMHGFNVWAKTSMQCDYSLSNAENTDTSLYNIPEVASSRLLNSPFNSSNGNLKRHKIPKVSKGRMQNNQSSTFPNVRQQQKTLVEQRKQGIKPAEVDIQPCEAVKLKGACAADGGPKWRTLESALYGTGHKAARKWHPPVGMHLLRAEVLAFNYAHIILDVLYSLEDAIQDAHTIEDGRINRENRNKNRQLAISTTTMTQIVANNRKGQGWLQTLLSPWISAVSTEEKTINSKESIAADKFHQVPIPTQPLYCSLEECLTSPPKCYTNNQPNYNLLAQLSEILVGGHMGWYQEPALVNDLHPELGLHDKKFYFKSEGAKNQIHFQLINVRSGVVRLYARSKKEPLDECVFLLDPHIDVIHNTTAYPTRESYRPSPLRYMLPTQIDDNTVIETDRSRSSGSGSGGNGGHGTGTVPNNGEMVRLTSIPPGNHVLTIMSSPNNPFLITSLSHIVVF